MVVMIGDGQVSVGTVTVKPNVRKVRRIGEGVVAGFAGTAADGLSLLERLEMKLEEHPGQLLRAAVELAKQWRQDKALRFLQAELLVADASTTLTISGNGDVLEPHDGVMGKKAMKIAADMCIYTNDNFTVESISVELPGAPGAGGGAAAGAAAAAAAGGGGTSYPTAVSVANEDAAHFWATGVGLRLHGKALTKGSHRYSYGRGSGVGPLIWYEPTSVRLNSATMYSYMTPHPILVTAEGQLPVPLYARSDISRCAVVPLDAHAMPRNADTAITLIYDYGMDATTVLAVDQDFAHSANHFAHSVLTTAAQARASDALLPTTPMKRLAASPAAPDLYGPPLHVTLHHHHDLGPGKRPGDGMPQDKLIFVPDGYTASAKLGFCFLFCKLLFL
ncbi:hypothetical protein VOLCADRAFT_92617 [Volvox carteri f. nagariensis]|uniref:Uncharacterized protein n=1 Tax=Volvox carteri f. nagariensis TaxID=3068 RepID=D8U042_VOLCA|nr:uncharacterized protein VOLCADRAFT_92617 [Volvox carteri f. nagariensis]EFJ46872.1 hypothetical protein VOLCADRAFT_92617 [Volvox carteri f. nagariensis]|eukprot:XP_002952081.1 hypothetical protein VOLCADRAFT_92617 [Volvox carteri f. nagariensis]